MQYFLFQCQYILKISQQKNKDNSATENAANTQNADFIIKSYAYVTEYSM